MKDEIYNMLQSYDSNRKIIQKRAINKLKSLLRNYDGLFNTIEVKQFVDGLKKKEEENDLHTSTH